MAAGLLMLLACMMAATGTPCSRATISRVWPGRSVIGVPPSQVQLDFGAEAARIAPFAASMRFAEALWAPRAGASLRETDEVLVGPNKSPKRDESAQPAAPNPINEMATSCGQMADRGDTRMVTHSYAIQGRANKQPWGKQGFKRRKIFRKNRLCVFGATVLSLVPVKAAQIAPQ